MTEIVAPDRAGRGAKLDFRDLESPAWALAAVMLLLVAQASMIFTRAINWDEFYHYGQLYDLAMGRGLPLLQTLYLRPFAWIVGLPGDGVDHIVIARLGMVLCELVTLAMIFLAARRFVDVAGATLAVLAYLSAGYILQHGFSFRADPAVTAVLMSALAILLRRRLDWICILGTGALLGLAGMLSIKAVLYAPAFAGVAWLRWREAGLSPGAAVKLASIVAVAALAFGLVYLAHQAAMIRPDHPATSTARATGLAGSAARYMFFVGRPNNLGMLVGGILSGLGLWSLIIMSPWAILKRRGQPGERIALAGMLAMVLWPAFYENTASYFHVFMLAPAAVAAAVSLSILRRKVSAMAIALLLACLSIGTIVSENRAVIDNQRRLLDTVDRLFPQPVAYFDHADVIARLDKRNPLQTPWGYKGYLANGRPIYREAMESEPVPLLIANWWTLREVLDGHDDHFLPEDAEALRGNYIPLAGPVWIAGKAVEPEAPREEEFLVPGPYTVRDATILVDGAEYAPGAVVRIERGMHRIAAAGTQPARLVWGERLEPRDKLDYNGNWVAF